MRLKVRSFFSLEAYHFQIGFKFRSFGLVNKFLSVSGIQVLLVGQKEGDDF